MSNDTEGPEGKDELGLESLSLSPSLSLSIYIHVHTHAHTHTHIYIYKYKYIYYISCTPSLMSTDMEGPAGGDSFVSGYIYIYIYIYI